MSPVTVAVYQIPGHRRSQLVCEAMAAGIAAVGDAPKIINELTYREPVADVAVFYGMVDNLPKILRDYPAAGKTAVYCDLGYFGRREGGRWGGYHKVAVNSRHPTAYFQAVKHDGVRAERFGIKCAPWKIGGKHILLAGMSGRGAGTEGFAPEEWERRIIAEIRTYSDRPIIYRPKPSWKEANPIDGTTFSPQDQLLPEVLEGCHAVVTHHSNVAVDGLIDGVPAFCWEGVARPMGLQDLSKIEHPHHPADRQQWLFDVSYSQFSVGEMRKGRAWRHLKDEGLLGQ